MVANCGESYPPQEYLIAVICPLQVELTAMLGHLDQEHLRHDKVPRDGNVYYFGTLAGLNVVIATLPAGHVGTISAANVAYRVKEAFPWIQLRLLVGIGGGVPSEEHDIRLGDVVVGIPDKTSGGVVEYDLGQRTPDGFKRKGTLASPPREYLSVVRKMQVQHDFHGAVTAVRHVGKMLEENPRLRVKYQRPPTESDILFKSHYAHQSRTNKSCHACDRQYIVERHPRSFPDEPVIHYGLIGSGDSVVRDAAERDLLGYHEGILCFEMEAAGLMNEFQCIVIRGISDYADSHKNDTWQAYAAVIAAGLAKEYIQYAEDVLCKSDVV
jgi:nucleoside phosphorylase